MFKFGISFLNRFSFLLKFLIIGTILLLPSILIFFPYLQAQNEKIADEQLKIDGLYYNEQIRQVQIKLMEHRALSTTFLSGDNSIQDELINKKAEIDQAVNGAKLASSNFEQHLKLTVNNSWDDYDSSINKLHNEVKDSSLSLQNSIALHNEIINDIINYSNFVANASELDSIFTQLPSLADALGIIRANGSKVTVQKQLLDNDEQTIKTLLSNAKIYVKQAENNIKTIVDFSITDKTYREKWTNSLSEINNFLKDDVETGLLKEKEIKITNEEFFNKATSVINDDVISILDDLALIFKGQSEAEINKIKITNYTIYSLFFIIILIAAYLSQSFYLSIKRNVKYIQEETSKMADGNFSGEMRCESKDEFNLITSSLEQMRLSVKSIVSDTNHAVSEVARSTSQLVTSSTETDGASEVVAKTIAEVADGTVVQSEQAQLIFKQIGHINNYIETSINLIEETNTDATEANFNALEGEKATKMAVEQGDEVSKTVTSTVNAIRRLDSQSREIEQIIDVMTTIADQTNLLALNASIEAARAGEHGRGFGVVAEEVRNLAEQSNEASQKVAQLIRLIQNETTETTKNMEDSVEAIRRQASLISRGNDAFKTIVNNTNKTSQSVKEIEMYINDINKLANELNDSALNISHITESTAASAEEVAASAQEQTATIHAMSLHIERLQKTAEQLTTTTSRFTV